MNADETQMNAERQIKHRRFVPVFSVGKRPEMSSHTSYLHSSAFHLRSSAFLPYSHWKEE
jgi:hypothetical protein